MKFKKNLILKGFILFFVLALGGCQGDPEIRLLPLETMDPPLNHIAVGIIKDLIVLEANYFGREEGLNKKADKDILYLRPVLVGGDSPKLIFRLEQEGDIEWERVYDLEDKTLESLLISLCLPAEGLRSVLGWSIEDDKNSLALAGDTISPDILSADLIVILKSLRKLGENLRVQPASSQDWFLAGTALIFLKKMQYDETNWWTTFFNRACACWVIGASLSPESASARNTLGYILYSSGNNRDALKNLSASPAPDILTQVLFELIHDDAIKMRERVKQKDLPPLVLQELLWQATDRYMYDFSRLIISLFHERYPNLTSANRLFAHWNRRDHIWDNIIVISEKLFSFLVSETCPLLPDKFKSEYAHLFRRLFQEEELNERLAREGFAPVAVDIIKLMASAREQVRQIAKEHPAPPTLLNPEEEVELIFNEVKICVHYAVTSYWRSESFEEFNELIEALLTTAPDDCRWLKYKVRDAVRNGANKEEQSYLAASLAQFPGWETLMWGNFSRIVFNGTGKMKDRLELLDYLCDWYRYFPVGVGWFGIMSFYQGNRELARERLSYMVELNPYYTSGYKHLAYNLEDAIEVDKLFSAGEKRLPNSYHFHTSLGSYFKKTDPERAKKHFLKALYLQPESSWVKGQLEDL